MVKLMGESLHFRSFYAEIYIFNGDVRASAAGGESSGEECVGALAGECRD